MIGKVKQWLGIEGVKLAIEAPEEWVKEDHTLKGKLLLSSKNPQTVKFVKVVLIEKYTRGRGKEKRIDEYQLGSVEMDLRIKVPAEGAVELEFSLPFSLVKSEMDEFAEKNLVTGGLAKAFKKLEGVHSEYRIEAEAVVDGVALNPFDKKIILIK